MEISKRQELEKQRKLEL